MSTRSVTIFPAKRKTFIALAAFAAAGLGAPASAGEAVERVEGYFCSAKKDQVAFLTEQARGENEIMAANAVNKAIAKASCAYYLPATAIRTGDHTVMESGLVYKLESYVFLPEKVERWRGTVLGSLQLNAQKQDI